MATYKQLNCRDAGVDCDFLVRAESEEEVMTVASEHACRVHGMCQVTPEFKEKAKSLIRTVMV
jgi:predicted small metal-binding protein